MQEKVTEERPAALSPFMINDPEEFAQNMLRLYEQGSQTFRQLLDRPDAKLEPYSTATELTAATENVTAFIQRWLSDPVKLAEAQAEVVRTAAQLWNNVLQRMFGFPVSPLIEPAPNDNRFKDPEWTLNPFFDFMKQAYLIAVRWCETKLAETEGLDERERQRAEFYLRQLTSAYSPSNFLATNPEVIRETFRTNGRNLINGLSLFTHDLNRSGDLLKISQTDSTAFEIGKNLATTPGKVVFENDVFQLIQYKPTTEKVYERPLLMVPPWINKFYILDLTPAKSFIKYAVDQGFTVFIVSWVNPDERLAHKTFEDYMQEGILTATDAVKRETGQDSINVLGYCVGGTLLSTTLAYTSQHGDTPFNSATLLTTQVDFSKAGDLLLFTDNSQLEGLERLMTERGFLDGSRMANVFNLMRPRDLVWPYVVNNYLLGKKPFAFDLLYWNQDSTRMPAANHRFYLREFYNENRLARGDMKIGGTLLDLKKITLPIFEVATKEDHIAPAVSVYRGSKLFGGPVEFVLSGSGHIAGVVNPPDKVKYQYWTDGDSSSKELDGWLGGATEHPGSWWPYWIEWLSQKSGKLITARQPGKVLGKIEDAPGRYVRIKS